MTAAPGIIAVGDGGADGVFTELAAALVDGNDGVGALVRVDPQDHLVGSPLTEVDEGPGRSAGMPQWGQRHAPIKPRRLVRAGVAGRTTGTGHADTEHLSEPATPSSLPSPKRSLTLRASTGGPSGTPTSSSAPSARPPAGQGHRPAAWPAVLPAADLGRAGPGQPGLTRSDPHTGRHPACCTTSAASCSLRPPHRRGSTSQSRPPPYMPTRSLTPQLSSSKGTPPDRASSSVMPQASGHRHSICLPQ
jgi:hypothetical protein